MRFLYGVMLLLFTTFLYVFEDMRILGGCIGVDIYWNRRWPADRTGIHGLTSDRIMKRLAKKHSGGDFKQSTGWSL